MTLVENLAQLGQLILKLVRCFLSAKNTAISFARSWGYGGQLVANVHAYRATDKNRLLEVKDPVGPENDEMILKMANESKTIVLAFGQPPKMLRSQDGTPSHPLYLPSTLTPQPY